MAGTAEKYPQGVSAEGKKKNKWNENRRHCKGRGTPVVGRGSVLFTWCMSNLVFFVIYWDFGAEPTPSPKDSSFFPENDWGFTSVSGVHPATPLRAFHSSPFSSWSKIQEWHTDADIATTPNPTKSEKSKHQVRYHTSSFLFHSYHAFLSIAKRQSATCFYWENIFIPQKWHDVGQTPTACAMDVNGNVKWPSRDLSAYATMEETEFAPTTRLYTPRWIIERTPLIFLMVVMAQSPATSNGTIDFNDHPRPMLSPSATSSNGPPKAVHWPILFFFNFSVFFFPTFQEENLSVLTLPKEPKDQDVVIQVWNWTVSPPFAPNNTPVSANQSNPSPVATVDPSPVPPSKLELYVRSWSRSKRL